MKKVLISILCVILALVALNVGIANDLDYQRKMTIEKQSEWVKRLATTAGLEYLGLVNIEEISKENGCVYDGPAIYAELLSRAGLPEDSDTWSFAAGSFGNVSVRKLTVYEEGQENTPVFERKVKQEFIYGVY